MKKHLAILLTFVCVLVGTSSAAVFAASDITEKNVQEGLAFCAQYPVSLTLDGEIITFAEADVPPFVVTPDGESAGRTLIPARALFEKAGAAVTWIDETQTVQIVHGDYTVELVIGSSMATVNGEAKELDVPALIIDHDGDYFGSTMIPVRFVAENLNYGVAWDDLSRVVAVTSPTLKEPNNGEIENPGDIQDGNLGENDEPAETSPSVIEGVLFPYYDMTSMPKLTDNASGRLIAVDMGHGGYDPGAVARSGKSDELREKDLNLAVGLRASELLKEAGFEVIMTRSSDVYVVLKTRAEIANEAEAELFVSFHNNSSENLSDNGTMVCYYNKDNDAEYKVGSKTIASAVKNEMVKALGTKDGGISKRPELAVLNKSVMPAIITEGAYISNPDNLEMMRTDEYIERYAFATVKAIIEAFNEAYPD